MNFHIVATKVNHSKMYGSRLTMQTIRNFGIFAKPHCVTKYQHFSKQNFSTQKYDTQRLEYSVYGIPGEVISHIKESKTFNLNTEDVLVKFLASPVNPADINTIQGSYPIKPTLPGVGGGEGVAQVLVSPCQDFQPGDWVLPARAMSGTWTTHAVYKHTDLIKLRNDIPVTGAATLMINPATALRMLEDYVNLQDGDVVVQNGANSAVGLAAIQIAKKKNVCTINIVRNRENIDDLKQYLTSLGADYVLTEEEARKSMRELPRPRLALNCVGGASATELCKALGDNGVHVTYGGMSLKPVTAGTSHLIFKNISVRGFWLSRWYKQQGVSAARVSMIEYLANMLHNGELTTPPLSKIDLEDFKEALDGTLKGYKSGKYIFMMDKL